MLAARRRRLFRRCRHHAPRTASPPRPPSSSPQRSTQPKLDAIAAADPAGPGTFVAALYFQGTSSWSCRPSTRRRAADREDQEKNYRDIYIDLSSASVAGSKVFVIDAGVDGLAPKPGDDGADSYEDGTKQVRSTATGRRRSCRKTIT